MNLPKHPPESPDKSGQSGEQQPASRIDSEAARAEADGSRRIGRLMIIGFWLLLLGLLYLWASRHLDFLANPNPSPQTHSLQGHKRVELAANRYGHYVAGGSINGQPVTFLLDTGATSVSVPAKLARQLNLEPGRPVVLHTANGTVTGYSVLLDSVAIGGLSLQRVSAHINPGQDQGEVLLGMSYLRHFQLTQLRNQLVIEEFR